MAILPRMNFFCVELKKLKIAYYSIGLYTALLGVLLSIDMKIYDELVVLALTASILLVIGTVILRLKAEKSILDSTAIVTGVFLLLSAILIAIIDIEEFVSSFAAITGALIILAIPYRSISMSKK